MNEEMNPIDLYEKETLEWNKFKAAFPRNLQAAPNHDLAMLLMQAHIAVNNARDRINAGDDFYRTAHVKQGRWAPARALLLAELKRRLKNRKDDEHGNNN